CPSIAEHVPNTCRTRERRRPAGRRLSIACADWIRSGLLVAPGRVRRLIGRALGGVLRRRGGLLARLARLVDGARGLLLGVLALGGRGVLRVLGGVLDPGRRLARGVLGVVHLVLGRSGGVTGGVLDLRRGIRGGRGGRRGRGG